MQAHSHRAGPTQALGVRRAEPEPPRSKPASDRSSKQGWRVFRRRAQENRIPRGAVQIGEPAAVLVPDVAELAQGIRLVEPPGRVVDPHRVEGLDVRKQVRPVRVAADDPGAVALDADNPPVFPVADAVLVGQLELVDQVRRRRLLFRGLLHVLDVARPGALFELVQKRCFGVRHLPSPFFGGAAGRAHRQSIKNQVSGVDASCPAPAVPMASMKSSTASA